MTTSTTRSMNQTVLIAFMAFIGLGMTSGLLGLAWPSMQKQFELPLDGVNILFLVSTVAYTIASFYIGRLMSRFSSGTTLMVGAILIVVALFGTAASATWLVVVVFGAFSGLGTGIVDAGLNLYIATYHSAQQMSWLHACFGIGITIGPLIMTFVLSRNMGWQSGYAFVGVILIALVVLIAVTRGKWRNEGFQTTENKPVNRASFASSLRVPVLWFGMLTFLAYVGVEIGIGQWAYTLMTESRGIAKEVAGLWVGLYWAAFTGGRFLFGVLSNRISVDRILRVCMGLTVIGTLLLWWNPIPAIGFIALVMLGFVQAPVFPLMMVGTAERVGGEHAENSISLQMSAVGIGTAFIPGLIGTIGKNFGLEMMAGSFVVMSIAVFFFHEMTRIRHVKPALATDSSSAD